MEFFGMVVNAFPSHFEGSVVDFGSLAINGGPHDLFASRRYIGVDVAPGPNVDVVWDGSPTPLEPETFDVAMSSECFEHNSSWPSTLSDMLRLVRPGGVIVISCAGIGRPEHGTPRSDGGFSAPLLAGGTDVYYRNLSAEILESKFGELASNEWRYVTVENRSHADIYMVAVKSPIDESEAKRFANLAESITEDFSRQRRPRMRSVALRLLGDRRYSAWRGMGAAKIRGFRHRWLRGVDGA